MSDRFTERALSWIESYIDWASAIPEADCESPIEMGLIKAFAAVRLMDRRLRLSWLPTSGPIETEWEATVIPQHPAGQYRLDFAVHVTAASGGRSLSAWIAVECDGHEFHERTREQAARDKARDRQLVAQGYRVLRFTGSEIYADNIKCALQVKDVAESIYTDWCGAE